ncbi:3'(2'),5'-bisphosphate nucleotidase CysQ [Parvibaculum sp.]|uniref:3'(2'),5'-bisphosphate nucleotidase CysQ n=1 Tax=Parvibaculum sp. TaxID=2024848 RepID=UPI001B0D8CEE|nr:3'(2'),5'-bisphosphate nucleotidase CysQ [Parvibaculum sp.]MBO6667786.1 3'(2'),5'-bisphosphate nucleotidase CysQ [Parvibaculum sp.]MBO6690649.1 3'(2'),5'-bisphosphate nucleotidase CysQ [Parvibaculum sp.]MBO6714978.1 3'(2'),5'-bisphosphate nucleotidase CysQ [Parvibaculum sp.]
MTSLISDRAALVEELRKIALRAGAAIMDHYHSEFEVIHKDDKSPVTAADRDAEAIILDGLRKSAPDIPIVSEEAAAGGHIPEIGHRFFLVDPLDGTKEFINKNGEFTVNIALIEDRIPVAGVVYAPAKDRMFFGYGAGNAFEQHVAPNAPGDEGSGALRQIAARAPGEDGLVVIASRTHRDTKTDEYLNLYKVKEFLAAGSSLKFCLVATGEADLYPRHGRTMEWDTAAGHAVLLAAGGSVTQLDGTPLLYGKTERGLDNPFFVARGALA